MGAACLSFNYQFALALLLLLLLAAYPWALTGLEPRLGRTSTRGSIAAALWHRAHNVHVLSAARMFLFGARYVWFEVRCIVH